MPRLFTAIEIPPEIRSELSRLHQPLPGARWLDKESYHLTLRFAGDIDRATAREFAANLDEIQVDTFALRITGLGAFGGHDPHAVWAGIEPSSELDTLQRAHERAARNAGLAPEKHPFKPHITLARLRNSNAADVARFLTHYGGYRSERFYVSRTVLMSARPGIGGGPYGIEEGFPMRDAGAYGDDAEMRW